MTKSTAVPPDEFICPLTKELIADPVMNRYGHRFERAAILKWLADGNNYCPVTGNPLRVSNLVSDSTLKWKINYWAKKHGKELIEVPNEQSAFIGVTGSLAIAIPEQRFLCPLTKEIMSDPIMSKNGKTFERSAILKWLDDMGEVCPITSEPLKPSDLVSNKKLQWEIGQWQLNYGDAAKEMTKLELDTKLSKALMVSKDYHLTDILRALTVDVELDLKEHGALKQDSSPETAVNVPGVLDDVLDALEG